PHSTPHPAPAATTTHTAPAGPPTTKPSAPWPTASSASSTAAYATDRPTTKQPPGQRSKTTNSHTPLDTLRPWDSYIEIARRTCRIRPAGFADLGALVTLQRRIRA